MSAARLKSWEVHSGDPQCALPLVRAILGRFKTRPFLYFMRAGEACLSILYVFKPFRFHGGTL